jgi:endonuclease/exonuclease/phosphatase (EEP) superfamily protein YafD
MLTALLRVALLGIAVATFLPLLWRIAPRATMFTPMAPQFAAAAALLAAVAILLRFRGFALFGIIAAVWNVALIWPDVSLFEQAPRPDGHPTLRVMTFNLWFDNENIGKTANYLATSGAEVIGLVEVTPRLKEGLTGLKAVYPYSIDCVGSAPRCQTMLFSKYPLRNAYAGAIAGRYPYIAIAEVDKPGATITVGVTHLSWPLSTAPRPALVAIDLGEPVPELPDVPALEQSVQAANLADFLTGQPGDLVLMGDFNSASWSPLHKSFRAATGLAEHRGLMPTWPTWAWPIFRLPIDHVFVRGNLRLVQAETGPNVGSDHLPVEAEIAVGR